MAPPIMAPTGMVVLSLSLVVGSRDAGEFILLALAEGVPKELLVGEENAPESMARVLKLEISPVVRIIVVVVLAGGGVALVVEVTPR
ncbi:hypothetical protein BD779DRAFT_1550928 [Infundibulicybe gibba]|nr:hypothetical protein BD779DRAFT_1550928 [Infundibulicybe gibba]